MHHDHHDKTPLHHTHRSIDRHCPPTVQYRATTVTMLRSGASRGILRSLNTASKPQFQVTSSLVSQQSRSQLCTISRRPQLASAAKPLALQTLAASKRWQTKGPMDTIDKKHEQEVGQQTIPVTPGSVSATSSMVAATDPPSRGDEKDPEMLAGIKADLVWHTFWHSPRRSWRKKMRACG